MRWLAELAEHHPELALDSEDDRARLVVLERQALHEQLAAIHSFLNLSMLAVLKVVRAEGAITSTTDVHALASRLAGQAYSTVSALLLDEPTT